MYTRKELIEDEKKCREEERLNNAYIKMLNDLEYRLAMGYKD